MSNILERLPTSFYHFLNIPQFCNNIHSLPICREMQHLLEEDTKFPQFFFTKRDFAMLHLPTGHFCIAFLATHSFYEWIMRMLSLRNVSWLKNTNTKLFAACWHIRCPVLTYCGQFHSKLVTWQQLSRDSTGICNFERNERIFKIKNLFKIKLMPLW